MMGNNDNANAKSKLGLIHKPLAEHQTKAIEYLPLKWPQFKIPIGKLTLFVGDPGECKSFVGCNTLAYLTREHNYQIIVLSEDDPEDMLKPRIEAMDGVPKLIEPITGTQVGIDIKRGFMLKTDMVLFRKLVIEKKPKVVFIDPVVSYSSGVDTFKGNEVRALLDPYVDLAREFRFALICVIHLNKADTKALYKISDSMQFSALAKSIYFFGPNPHKDDPENKVVCHLKTNVSKKTPSYSFHIESVPSADGKESDLGKLVWGHEVDLTVEDVSNAALKNKGGNVNKMEIASSFLLGSLRRGPQPTTELETLAVELDIKEKTLKRARRSLNVASRRIGGTGPDGHWVSFLPGYEDTPPVGEHDPLTPLVLKELREVRGELGNVTERLSNIERVNDPLSKTPLVGQRRKGGQAQKVVSQQNQPLKQKDETAQTKTGARSSKEITFNDLYSAE